MTLTTGKWRRRDGLKVTVTVGKKKALVEMECGHAYVVHLDGRHSTGCDASFDVTEKGWPLELVAGRWYRTSGKCDQTEGQLVAAPKWHVTASFVIYYQRFSSYVFEDGSLQGFDGVRIVEEIDPPAWSKETA